MPALPLPTPAFCSNARLLHSAFLPGPPQGMLPLIAPLLPHMAEDAWQALPYAAPHQSGALSRAGRLQAGRGGAGASKPRSTAAGSASQAAGLCTPAHLTARRIPPPPSALPICSLPGGLGIGAGRVAGAARGRGAAVAGRGRHPLRAQPAAGEGARRQGAGGQPGGQGALAERRGAVGAGWLEVQLHACASSCAPSIGLLTHPPALPPPLLPCARWRCT